MTVFRLECGYICQAVLPGAHVTALPSKTEFIKQPNLVFRNRFLLSSLTLIAYPTRKFRVLLPLRWHVGMPGMVRGLEKNFYAGLNFRPLMVVVGVLGLAVLGVLPHVGLFVGPLWARAVCLAGIASAAVFCGAARGMDGVRWYHALVVPFGAIALIVALLRSVALTITRGGVLWRDQLYRLDILKQHVRQRNTWANEVWKSTR